MSDLELVSTRQVAALLGYKHSSSVCQRRRADSRFPQVKTRKKVKAGSGAVLENYWDKAEIIAYKSIVNTPAVGHGKKLDGLDNKMAMAFITGKRFEKPVTVKKTVTVHVAGV